MKLILIRHGESIGNTKQGFISGASDKNGLSAKGRIQIIRTAYGLRHEKLEDIFSSPVKRARETAGIVANFFEKPVQNLNWLSELDHGIFEGHYWWEVIHKIPPSWRARHEDFSSAYPKGESMEDLIMRVSAGLDKTLPNLKEGKTYIFVSHQAVITTIRYCLEFGGYKNLTSAKKKDEFLKYLHNVKLNNGATAIINLKNLKFQSSEEVSDFKNVKIQESSVSFYAKGLLDLKDLPKAEKFETASENKVFKLNAKLPSILKIIKNEKNKAFERQIELYNYLKIKKILAPKVIKSDSSTVFFKDNVLVQNYIEGGVSTPCFVKHPDKTEGLLEEIFKSLDKIHNLPKKEVEDFWKPPLEPQFVPWKNSILFNINMTLHILQEEYLPKKTFAKVAEALSCLKDYVREERYAICPIHADLASENILVHHNHGVCELAGLVDFEWARMGDPLWDFVYFLGWLERDNKAAALRWRKILQEKLPDQMIQLEWYRILFHAWTVRDMAEYKESELRQKRGKKSMELIIHNS